MSKQGRNGGFITIDGLINPTKIRKRGCSSSSSSSSRIHHYRLTKKAIVVNKNRTGIAKSRSCTPVPAWKMTPLRSVVDSPKYSLSGKSTRPVSARRLAATLWEMNEMPSPKMSESNFGVMKKTKKSENKAMVRNEKMPSRWGLNARSVSLPPHLSDPSHSPSASEKMDRSGTGRLSRRAPSISQKLRSARPNIADDSVSNASFMEIETRSRSQISSSSVTGHKNRLKDVSNALTTSKELLKIINRIWAPVDQPSSSMSLVSALHAELERARLQTNQLIQEQRSDSNEINYLMQRFAKEKAMWKDKEEKTIELAITSVAAELDVERKLRRRLESLNKKLGKELAETKSAFVKVVKELESEKRAREVTEHICNELARNIDEDRAEVEKLKRESVEVHQELEKEREMLEFSDKLHEERAHLKLSEAKHQYEEKNSAIRKLRKQLEVFLGAKREKNQDRAAHLMNSHQEDDHGEVEDHALVSRNDSLESDLHSIVLNVDDRSKAQALSGFTSADSNRVMTEARNSVNSYVSRKGTSLQRSVSEGFEDVKAAMNEQSFEELGKDAPRRSYNGETQRYDYKSAKNMKGDHSLSSTRLSLTRDYLCSTPPREQVWPSRDPLSTIQESPSLIQASGFKSRGVQSLRKSKR